MKYTSLFAFSERFMDEGEVYYRETSSIEMYAPALVDTLESCLGHNMTMLGPNGIRDTAHCKIASDLLSSLFLVCWSLLILLWEKSIAKWFFISDFLKLNKWE